MSKFDRCIFISIAIGIWALAMTQVFESKTIVASDNDWIKDAARAAAEKATRRIYDEASYAWMRCPKQSKERRAELEAMYESGAISRYAIDNCRYQLVATYSELQRGVIPEPKRSK